MMAKIGKERGNNQYKKGKLMFGEFLINHTNNQATPSPVIIAKIISIFFIFLLYPIREQKSRLFLIESQTRAPKILWCSVEHIMRYVL